MPLYKITNITKNFSKRNKNYNIGINIKYVKNYNENIVHVNPDEHIYINFNKIPISVHKLILENFIIIDEVSEFEYKLITENNNDNTNTINEDNDNIITEIKEKNKKKNKL